MNGEATFNIITQLKVLSKVKEGQKVSVRNGCLQLDKISDGFWAGAKRWYYNDSRMKTYNYVRNLMFNAIMAVDDEAVVEAVQKSMTGINSLKVTYSDDEAIVASYEVLVERMEKIIMCHSKCNKSDPELKYGIKLPNKQVAVSPGDNSK